MQTSALMGKSFFGLIRQLPEAAKAFVKNEIELAKTEISEKLACLARNAVTAVAGAVTALAGIIVLLGGAGVLLGRTYERLGCDPVIAVAVGLVTVGLLVALIGGAFVLKGAKKLGPESFKPEKTVETLTVSPAKAGGKQAEVGARAGDSSSDEAEAEALASKTQVRKTIEEIGMRLKPDDIKRQLHGTVHAHPYQWAVGSMLVGVLSGFLLHHRMRTSAV